MTATFLILLFQAMHSITNLVEAWLERVVIDLKNDSLSNYRRLNAQEHTRSFIYSSAVASPYVIAALFLGLYWIIPPLLINRRMVFDPSLKLFRGRKLARYEGNGPVDNFCKSIFGRNGAHWEVLVELAITVACTWYQLAHLNNLPICLQQ